MDFERTIKLLGKHPTVERLAQSIQEKKQCRIYVDGLSGSSTALIFASLNQRQALPHTLYILDDEEEAGYFYHDLTQIMTGKNIMFFPSSYRQAIRNAQKDPANEVLRTDVLVALTNQNDNTTEGEILNIVTYPEAIKELVISQNTLKSNTLTLNVGESYDTADLEAFLFDMGFQRTDYVYEPGQFAVRGSIFDIFSFSSEMPYRIDFFGDDVDSIRTFDIQTQLSDKKVNSVAIVPEMESMQAEEIPFTHFLTKDTLIVMSDRKFVEDRAEMTFNDFRCVELKNTSFTDKSRDVKEGVIHFNTSRQPLFHKNFDLMKDEFNKLVNNGYKLNICADDVKQLKRLKEIFTDISFHGIEQTLHAGFIEHDMKLCYFTDHQIFDRYHKYSLRSEKARRGKIALTLKEIQQFEIGDYVVHIDHGVGKFGGLVRVPNNGTMQEMIMLKYKNDDTVYVSIHALHKLSKYKGKDGEAPTLSRLGTGAWNKIKERVKEKVKDIARDLIKLYAQRQKEKGFAFSQDSYLQHELESSFMYEDTPDQYKATQDVKADMEREQPMDRLICGDVGFGKTEVAIRAAFKAACDGKQVAVLVPTTVLAYQHYKTFQDRLKDLPVTIDYLSRARTTTQIKTLLKNLALGKIDIVIGTHKLIGKDVKFKDLGLLIIDEEQKFGVAVKEKLRQMKVNVDTITMTATPIPRTLQFSLMGARDLSIIQTPPTNRYPIQTEINTLNDDVVRDAINFEMSRNGQVFFVNNKISNLHELEDMIHRCVPDARVCIGHGRMNPSELEEVVLDFMNHEYDVMLSTTIVENGIDIPNANTIIINAAQNYGLSDLHQMRGRVGRSNKKAFCYLLAPPLAALNDDARRRLKALENFSDLGMGIQIAMQDLDIRGAGNLLGAEQSGFIADLGYETYQKVLKEAISELRQNEFAEMDFGEEQNYNKSGNDTIWSGKKWVDDVVIESDLPTYFHDDYVPTSGERISLYRELDSLETQEQLTTYKAKLIDRFGKIPFEANELIDIMPLKWNACRLGIEKITLKDGKMILYFLSDFSSPLYFSDEFGKVITYLSSHTSSVKLRDGEKRSLLVKDVKSVTKALSILNDIIAVNQQ
ncbi:MAG: transcription-repair coupling factor [Prevotellaceae bacterium]|nr:transcription-repair coupling factor [Candidatus Colivivens equi]